MSEPTEREWLEGLRYEDKFPEHTGELVDSGEPYGEVWECADGCPACDQGTSGRGRDAARELVEQGQEWGDYDPPASGRTGRS